MSLGEKSEFRLPGMKLVNDHGWCKNGERGMKVNAQGGSSADRVAPGTQSSAGKTWWKSTTPGKETATVLASGEEWDIKWPKMRSLIPIITQCSNKHFGTLSSPAK